MADLGISISLNSSQYTQGLAQVTAQTNAAAQNIDKSLNTVSNAANEGGKAMQAFTSNLGGLGNLLGGGLVVGAATLAAQAITSLVGSIVDLGKESIQVASDVQTVNRALAFTAGSAEEGAASYDRFKDVANGLGISIEKNQKAFKNFVVSATQSGQTLGQAETEFRQVATAITAMGLSAEDSNGVLLALGQIASKGTVSAEELRGQIGERLPGAFAIAARSIGVTEAKLNDMLQKGQVVSKDFLPQFTAELERTFGASAQEGVNSYAATVNRFDNTLFELKATLGEALLPTVIDVFSALTELFTEIKDFTNSAEGKEFGSSLVDSFVIIQKSISESVSGLAELYKAINRTFGRENTNGLKDFADAINFLARQVDKSLTPFKLLNDLLGTKKPVQSVNGNDLGFGSVTETDELGKYLQEKEGDFKRFAGVAKKEADKVKKALKEIPQAGSLGDLENQLKAINDTFQNKTGFDVAKLTGRKEDLEGQIKRLKELYGLIKTVPEAAAGSLSALQKQLAEVNKQINETPSDSGLIETLTQQAFDLNKEIEKVNANLANARGLAVRGSFGLGRYDVTPISESLIPKQGQIAPAENLLIAPQADTSGLDNLISKLNEVDDKVLGTQRQLIDSFQKIKDSAFQSLGDGLANVAQTFGNSIGQLITGVTTFEEVMKSTLLSLGQAILVELPKVVGMGLVQSAFSPVGIASFPANIPLALAGLALIGASGLMGGLLSGMGSNNNDTIAAQTASAGQIGGTGTTAQATAQGLGSNSAANTQAVTNVTVVLNTNGILTALEKQQYINGLLAGG